MNGLVWGSNYMIPVYDEEDPLANIIWRFEEAPLYWRRKTDWGVLWINPGIHFCQ